MRRWPMRALAAAAGAAVLWTAAWFGLASHIERRTVAWIERERARGATLEARRLSIDGYPFTWRLVAEDYAIAGAGPMAQRATGARLEATVLPWRLHDVPIRLPGRHRIERRDGDATQRVELEAERPDARLVLGPTGRVRAIDLDLGGLALRLPPAEAVVATAGRARVVARDIDPVDPATRDFWNLALTLEAVDPPTTWMTPFNRRIEHATAEIGVRGERVRAATPADAVVAWRDSGGVVELRNLVIDWAPLAIAGAGTAALDRENRPEAALSLRIAGYDELLAALVQAKQITSRQATGLRIAFAALARPNPETRRNEVQLPITAQDGQLTVMGFPVVPLPPVPLPRP